MKLNHGIFWIGRYGVAFGRVIWLQTQVPTSIRHFLFFWLFKEARTWDDDKDQKFPPGTSMEYDGTFYRYYKARGPNDT